MKESKLDDVKKKLAPFRAEIDRIDDAIMELMGERFGIVRQVARIKVKNDIHIVQTARVQEVKARNAKTAKKYGISPELIRAIYALIIDEAHNVEHNIEAAAKAKRPSRKK
jgi:4-amino-4-deoxychorismate mutase